MQGGAVLRTEAQAVTPTVSVLTPSLNGAPYLADALESVARQADAGVEHLILDGGSQDDTQRIAARFPHARLIVQRDRGSHDAMNASLRKATGDIVCFLNTDDVLLAGAIERARFLFRRHPEVTMAHGLAGFYRQHGDGCFRFENALRLPEAVALIEAILLGVPCLNAWFFRRTLLDGRRFDIGFSISADRHFLAASVPDQIVGRIDAPVYAYRIHQRSNTMSRRPAATAAFAREHLTIAARLMQEFRPGDPRYDLAADLIAFEHARIMNANWHSGDSGAAMTALLAGFASSPLWPLRLARALARRRRFYRTSRVEQGQFPGEIPTWAETPLVTSRCSNSSAEQRLSVMGHGLTGEPNPPLPPAAAR